MFDSRSEAVDHQKLMAVIDDMEAAEPSCWSYPEIFFEPDEKPEVQQRGMSEEQRMAVSLCNGCEVRNACAEYALKWYPAGIWGGTTDSSRIKLRAIRNKAKRNK